MCARHRFTRTPLWAAPQVLRCCTCTLGRNSARDPAVLHPLDTNGLQVDWRISLGRFQPPTNWTAEVTKMSGIYPHFTKVGAELDTFLVLHLALEN